MAVLLNLLKGRLYPPAPIHHSFTGKTVIVTGANTGIGYEAALNYVRLQASTVILAVRSPAKGDQAKKLIEEKTGRHDVVQVWELNMDNFASVEAFAKRVETSLPRLDILVLNAGVLSRYHALSSDGWEKMLQVNTLSTALLAILLLPKLQTCSKEGDLSHLEVVTSIAYQDAKVDPENNGQRLHHQNKHDDFMDQYNQSKIFMMWITRELAERCLLPDTSPTVIINDTCPGGCSTEALRDFETFPLNLIVRIAATFLFRTAEQGARTIVGATTLGVESHGRFWTNDEYKTYAKPKFDVRGGQTNAASNVGRDGRGSGSPCPQGSVSDREYISWRCPEE
ncbi:MAG: hypothetical protein Q9202_000044 [Teloschistes flavicans]